MYINYKRFVQIMSVYPQAFLVELRSSLPCLVSSSSILRVAGLFPPSIRYATTTMTPFIVASVIFRLRLFEGERRWKRRREEGGITFHGFFFLSSFFVLLLSLLR
jgi:hypothetical protein